MKKEAKVSSKPLNKNTIVINGDLEDINYDKVFLAIDSVANMNNMSKHDFLENIFVGAFQLIPEAEKGSFFELVGDFYVPIFSNGYEIETLQKLVFNRRDAFVDYECSDDDNIEAYERKISKRDDSKFSEETIEILKKLGTYTDFACLYAPIQVDGINTGMICLDCFNNEGFSNNSKRILKFYAQIISNFYSQKLFHEKEKKMYDDIVTALVSAIEVNDKYTEGHAQRVREYSCALAKELKLSEDKIRDISTAALLHDIGKIGISTEILNKPGKLTSEEYSEIKKHPVYTKKILEKISGFSTITNYASNHHENYDGTGYPQGLKGDQIPFESQIIQVADAYDAMTSERAYRKALSSLKAMEVITMEMGKQFNPNIAKVAIELFTES